MSVCIERLFSRLSDLGRPLASRGAGFESLLLLLLLLLLPLVAVVDDDAAAIVDLGRAWLLRFGARPSASSSFRRLSHGASIECRDCFALGEGSESASFCFFFFLCLLG